MRRFFEEAGLAIRANFVPGLVLNCLLGCGVVVYFFWGGFREILGVVAEFRARWGVGFVVVSYVISCALLPEMMKVICFQGWRVRVQNLRDFLIAAPFFGVFGIFVDCLYRLQAVVFGEGVDFSTIFFKVLFDQLVFSPLLGTPLALVYFGWAEGGFRMEALRRQVAMPRLVWRVFGVLCAGWLVWFPGVSVIYSVPRDLQVPVAVTISAFWILIFTTLRRRQEEAMIAANGAIRGVVEACEREVLDGEEEGVG